MAIWKGTLSHIGGTDGSRDLIRSSYNSHWKLTEVLPHGQSSLPVMEFHLKPLFFYYICRNVVSSKCFTCDLGRLVFCVMEVYNVWEGHYVYSLKGPPRLLHTLHSLQHWLNWLSARDGSTVFLGSKKNQKACTTQTLKNFSLLIRLFTPIFPHFETFVFRRFYHACPQSDVIFVCVCFEQGG